MDYYFRKLSAAFRAVNNDNVDDRGRPIFEVLLTNTHVCVYRNGEAILRVGRDSVSVRNLYLELHSCQYNVMEWLGRRQSGEFNNENYETTPSPP
jgi:hypothetical protein